VGYRYVNSSCFLFFFVFLQANLIHSYDKRVWFFNVYKKYYEFIRRHGNPYIKEYDDRQAILDKKVKTVQQLFCCTMSCVQCC